MLFLTAVTTKSSKEDRISLNSCAVDVDEKLVMLSLTPVYCRIFKTVTTKCLSYLTVLVK